jgi:hypothetical protein
MPSSELRDLRTLLLHRHQWVRMRTRVVTRAAKVEYGYLARSKEGTG